MGTSDHPTDPDILVVGGGPAGCSTAVFTARYGLETVVLDRGASSLRQCAFIENYLGFPGGIDVPTFAAMSHAHAERVGATVVAEMATDVTRAESGFRVETRDGTYTPDRLVAASTYDVAYLDSLLDEHLREEHGETYVDPDLAGERGDTPVEGLWLAGPTAGVDSQIAVAAGHGARVGIDVVTDYRREVEGLWGPVADYTDWVVEQGRYAGEAWLENAVEYAVDAAPAELDDAVVTERARAAAIEQQNQQIDDEEVERRTERAHRRLLDHVDDDLILERARELDAAEVDG